MSGAVAAYACALPLPACGERVGVSGLFQALGLAEAPPHPDFARKRAKSDLSPQAGRGERGARRAFVSDHEICNRASQ